MPKKHVSVWKTYFVWGFAVLIMLAGLSTIGMLGPTSSASTGVGLVLGGAVLLILNKFVFRLRTTQLKIDTMEAHRDSIGNACPECGTRNKVSARFCENCRMKF
jgi:hypothetical protein